MWLSIRLILLREMCHRSEAYLVSSRFEEYAFNAKARFLPFGVPFNLAKQWLANV